MTTQHPLVDRKQAAELLGISPATFDRMRAKPPANFPDKVELGERLIRWRRAELLAWMNGGTNAA